MKILLENTAGQGSAIGYRFEHLKEIIVEFSQKESAFALIPAMLFLPDMILRNDDAFNKTFDEFDRIVGLDNLKAIHH